MNKYLKTHLKHLNSRNDPRIKTLINDLLFYEKYSTIYKIWEYETTFLNEHIFIIFRRSKIYIIYDTKSSYWHLYIKSLIIKGYINE